MPMKIIYLAFLRFMIHENLLPRLPSLHWIGVMTFSIKQNKLPYICSMYDTGFKVLSMKIKYFAPFKHKHSHQKFAHEN